MSLQKPLLAKGPGDIKRWGELAGSSLALCLAEGIKANKATTLVVVPDTPTALKVEEEVRYFLEKETDVLLFPDWETLPYDHFSPHQDIISQRLTTLYTMRQHKRQAVIIPINTLMAMTCPTSFLDKYSLVINKGDRLDFSAMKLQLETGGYHHVQQVMEHGEYSARGSIIDLFPMGSSEPYRIDFFDDEIDSIRPFDPDTQRSKSPQDSLKLLPAHEFPTDKQGIELFRRQYRERFDASNQKESVYQQVSKGTLPAGIEYYLPLFFDSTANILDYLPEEAQIFCVGNLEDSAEHFWQDIQARFEDRSVDPLRPLLSPQEVFLRPQELFARLKQWARVLLGPAAQAAKTGRQNFGFDSVLDVAINHQLQDPLSKLKAFQQAFDGRVLICSESQGRRESLQELVHKHGLKPAPIDSFSEFVEADDPLAITVSPIEHSFRGATFAVITETELLGNRVRQRRRRQASKVSSPESMIRNLAELSIGQPVVHSDHGVGRYAGLQTLNTGGIDTEFVTLEYAKGDKLYVPVSSLHLITRYSGSDTDTAPLNKLGNETWSKAKKKAVEKIRDVAAELLDIYAKRESRSGFSFDTRDENYQQFSANFPFEETADQAIAIEAVIQDMRAPQPMDRLVCGDVGFGKTEVAMRAAFTAVNAGKQVAVLVPTTLLAQQHYDNFLDRFADWPVKIEVMSRFRTAKQQQGVIEQLAEGKVDILIGTHKLLQRDVNFHDLGLLIVDEEHRFGVRQKERLKAMRADVDILTLTATPIPRTLNMALGGMRDLSIIATPPARRLAVKTFVRQFDERLIREAVMRELLRGGQVYFLHNDVATIEATAEKLEKIVPEARIAIAHGQMRERELEQVMSEFYHQRSNVLVCTTIIETGIDVPSANTIIMDRADHLGLAQLHQLRGRVGRSHHQAYAYLLTPHPKRMTKDAAKRLEAISQLEDLGAGFALATHDLEIRGAGELLGEDQSGQISAIGFSLYMEMLENAVEALKKGEEPSLEQLLSTQTEIDLRIPALLPETYIDDVNLRLSLYKRIANCQDDEQLDDIQIELIDRFGLLPEPVKNLVSVSGLRQRASQLGIKRIEAGPQGGTLEFGNNAQIDPAFLIGLIQQQPKIYRMEGPERFRFNIPAPESTARLKLVEQMLSQFEQNKTR